MGGVTSLLGYWERDFYKLILTGAWRLTNEGTCNSGLALTRNASVLRSLHIQGTAWRAC